MSDSPAKPRLSVSEIAGRLRITVSTASRLMDDGDLTVVRERGWRKAYAAQVEYIAAALDACRSGSIEQFAAEWRAMQDQKVSA